MFSFGFEIILLCIQFQFNTMTFITYAWSLQLSVGWATDMNTLFKPYLKFRTIKPDRDEIGRYMEGEY